MLSPFERIVEALASSGLPDDVMGCLPRRWEKVGDVLLVKVDDRVLPYSRSIFPVYAGVLRVKAVLRDLGIDGRFREPRVEILHGKRTETVHRENGVIFHTDPAAVMFSSGNVGERKRMADIGEEGEMVVDMFAGIGYFIVPMAVHSKVRGIAFEINPVAHAFLERNIDANDVHDLVSAVLGDCIDAPEGIADRVVMGYFDDTETYLRKAMRMVSSAGGMIHCHSVCPEELVSTRPHSEVARSASFVGRTVEISDVRVVKSYAPGVVHIVVDISVEPAH